MLKTPPPGTGTGVPWPILKTYDSDHLARIALPLGGLGTGTVSLGGRGDFRDWELMNRPAKGFVPMFEEVSPFFCLVARTASGPAVGRVLEGPLPEDTYEGSLGCLAPQHGFPRFRKAQFHAAYPLGQVDLEDPAVPLNVTLQAFNPLIPCKVPDSSLPVVVIRYVVHNPGPEPVQATVCGTMPNYIGVDASRPAPPRPNAQGSYAGAKDNRNAWRTGDAVQGVYMTSAGVAPDAEAWGTMALTCARSAEATYRTHWPTLKWGYHKRQFWEELMADGRLTDQGGISHTPIASLAIQREIHAGTTAVFSFHLTWHFPNRMSWTPTPDRPEEHIVGNAYCARFPDAWAAAESIVPRLPVLEADTVRFVDTFCRADLPLEVREAALFNISTLRTQTCFQTPDGLFFYWEGSHDHVGSCYGNCTHVWNYEQATAFLFGELALRAREVEFLHATNDQGLQAFRVPLPLTRLADKSAPPGVAAADGQMGCLMKIYREWQLSGDDDWLRTLWPHAKRAIEFCWLPGGWDADQDGVMEGCQHNTMDVEYFGPNPQMGFWYLGALNVTERMARHLGDEPFARRCAGLREQGAAWMDAHLFNGEYYIHEVRPPMTADRILDGLRMKMGTDDLAHPDLQLANGCLIDQLAGQYMAHVLGLGHLSDQGRIRSSLKSILKYNRRSGFRDHVNHMRSFAMGDESALLMAAYPHGRPERPFPYYSEVMTGFEYAAAVHLLYEGMIDEGLQCIRDIRARYDGAKRSPFNEAECGHHYGRAMASWGAVLALTGFRYSAVDRTMSFRAAPGRYFWSTGFAWGSIEIGTVSAELNVIHGDVALDSLTVNGRKVDGPMKDKNGGSRC